MQTLEHFLVTVMDWMWANRLRLNPDKMEILLLGRHPDQLWGLLLGLDGVTLPLMDQACNLDVL